MQVAVVGTDATGAGQAQFKPAAVNDAAHTLVKCGTTRTIGIAYPATGPAASIGVLQFHWAQFFQNRWNKAHSKDKIRFVQGDTQLPNTAQALAVAPHYCSISRPSPNRLSNPLRRRPNLRVRRLQSLCIGCNQCRPSETYAELLLEGLLCGSRGLIG